MAFITAETRSDIIALVVTMLNRAPDSALLDTLVTASTSGKSLAEVADLIADTAEFTAENGASQTAQEYATAALDRAFQGATVTADLRTAAIDLAVTYLNDGMTKAGLASVINDFLALPSTLENADFGNIAAAYANKNTVAEYYVLDADLGDLTAAELTSAIASVTDEAASVTTATAAADAAEAAANVVAGEALTLTVGLDTLTGGSADDTFSAQDTGAPLTGTLTIGDTLPGGAGTDTLNISASGAVTTTAGVRTSGIEAVSLYNNSTAGYTVDAALMTGLTDVYVNGGTNTATFGTVGSLPNLHLISTSFGATVTATAAAVAGAADEAIILSNGSAQAAGGLTATYNGIETINFAAAGTTGAYTLAVTNNSLTLASTDLETVVVTGDSAANLTANFAGAALETQTSTFDASAAGGSITAHITKGASATAAVTMSAQGDHLDFNGALASTITLDGGDGADTLELDTALAYSAAAAAAGTAQAGDGVSNFEVLYLAAGNAVDERALTNNAGITQVVALAGGSYTKSTALATVTQLSTAAFTTTAATDGDADTLTMNLAGAGVVSTLSAANVETLTVGSAGSAANTATMSAAGSADLTSITAVGTQGLTLNISGTKLATVNAAGITGVGSAFVLAASASTADMTVTGSDNRPTVALTGIANDITTGTGDDTITGGAYRDDISAGNGVNTITAGDGANQITSGRGNDTITAGDGNNTINAGSGDNTVTVGDGTNGLTLGNGDDTVTAGGTTTSATVMDVNTVDLGNGDDTYTGGAGRDVVTLGSGDDTVNTGAGADSIYMSDYDDDDVVDAGTGTDALSASALASAAAMAAAGAQIQAAAVHVDLTPGATRTNTPQFTGAESVYIDANIAAANDGTALLRETIDFSTTTGISNLYLNTTDANTASTATLVLNKVDAAAIHLQDSGADAMDTLNIVGTGQASLTLKGHAQASTTAITVTKTDAVTVTSYVDNATAAVTDTIFGVLTLDEAETVTVTGAGVASTVGTVAMTTGAISADSLEALTLSAGSNSTLTLGAIDTAGDDLLSIDIDISEDGTMALPSIAATAGSIDASTMTIDVGVGGLLQNSGGATPVAISADSIETVTVTVGAAATMRADFVYAGTTTVTQTAGSTTDIDNIGLAGAVASFTYAGRGTVTNAIAVAGETTYNFSGLNSGAAQTVNAGNAGDKTIIGNNEANNFTTGAGDDSITGGTGIDTVTDAGTGDDTLILGAGNDIVTDAGTGDDIITLGAGDDVVTDAGTGDDVITFGAGADSADAGPGADSLILTETVAAIDNVIQSAIADSATFALNAGAVNSTTTVGMDVITGMDATDTFELSMYTGIAAGIGADTLLDTDEAVQLTSVVAGGTLPAANSIGTVRGTYDADTDTFVGSTTGVDLVLVYDSNPLVAVTALEGIVIVGGGALTITVAAGATGVLDIA